ncbi:MAG: hypothetical protein V4792_04765, partial [Pseudomonadota bacterium]
LGVCQIPFRARVHPLRAVWKRFIQSKPAGLEARRLLGELARRQPQFDHHHIYACFTLFTVGCLARLEGQ